jgi:hypothetical protein
MFIINNITPDKSGTMWGAKWSHDKERYNPTLCKLRPVGQMRPVIWFCAARGLTESFHWVRPARWYRIGPRPLRAVVHAACESGFSNQMIGNIHVSYGSKSMSWQIRNPTWKWVRPENDGRPVNSARRYWKVAQACMFSANKLFRTRFVEVRIKGPTSGLVPECQNSCLQTSSKMSNFGGGGLQSIDRVLPTSI